MIWSSEHGKEPFHGKCLHVFVTKTSDIRQAKMNYFKREIYEKEAATITRAK
jgi:hypothetical protein